MNTLLQYIILAVIIASVFFLKSLFSKEKENISDKEKVDPKYFVDELERLDYFKYTDENLIDSLKQHFLELAQDGTDFYTEYDEETGLSWDYREYLCDGETLYESGGFDSMLFDLKPAFEKMGLKMNSMKCQEIYGINGEISYSIVINDKKYIIFDKFTGLGWGEAPVKLVEILNDQLQIQNKSERAYLISGANDGRMIFLTEAQFDLIDKTFSNDQWKPLPIDRWCKEMKVEMPE